MKKPIGQNIHYDFCHWENIMKEVVAEFKIIILLKKCQIYT